MVVTYGADSTTFTSTKVRYVYTILTVHTDCTIVTVQRDYTILIVHKDYTIQTVHTDYAILTVHTDYTILTVHTNCTIVTVQRDYTILIVHKDYTILTVHTDYAILTVHTEYTIITVHTDYKILTVYTMYILHNTLSTGYINNDITLVKKLSTLTTYSILKEFVSVSRPLLSLNQLFYLYNFHQILPHEIHTQSHTVREIKLSDHNPSQLTSSTHLMARTILYLSSSVNTGGPLCFNISADNVTTSTHSIYLLQINYYISSYCQERHEPPHPNLHFQRLPLCARLDLNLHHVHDFILSYHSRLEDQSIYYSIHKVLHRSLRVVHSFIANSPTFYLHLNLASSKFNSYSFFYKSCNIYFMDTKCRSLGLLHIHVKCYKMQRRVYRLLITTCLFFGLEENDTRTIESGKVRRDKRLSF